MRGGMVSNSTRREQRWGINAATVLRFRARPSLSIFVSSRKPARANGETTSVCISSCAHSGMPNLFIPKKTREELRNAILQLCVWACIFQTFRGSRSIVGMSSFHHNGTAGLPSRFESHTTENNMHPHAILACSVICFI